MRYVGKSPGPTTRCILCGEDFPKFIGGTWCTRCKLRAKRRATSDEMTAPLTVADQFVKEHRRKKGGT